MRLLVALLIIVVIALCAVVIPEHRPQNAGLPVVKATYNPAAPDLLFAPCPLGPRNLPIQSERKA